MSNSEFVDKAREHVKDLSHNHEINYQDVYDYHLVDVADWAEKLSTLHGADLEIVLIAAWLHDIGSMLQGRKDHHISGQRLARDLLLDWGYDPIRTERVCSCIYRHRGSQHKELTNAEERVVAEADAIANILNIVSLIKVPLVFEGKTQYEAAIDAEQKIRRKWAQLSTISQALLQREYDALAVVMSSYFKYKRIPC